MKCECGFKFKITGYKNFQVDRFENGKWIMICPDCGNRVVGEGVKNSI